MPSAVEAIASASRNVIAGSGEARGTEVLLSTSHNFIFVHVPKTAGSAVHVKLRPYGHESPRTALRSLSRRLPIVESPEKAHFRIHSTADEIRRKLSPRVFDRFLSFAIIRNPFDHAVSHYLYLAQYRNKRIAERFARMSFQEYLGYRLAPGRLGDRIFVRLPDQSHFVCDPDGRVLVSRVLRFETLNEDFGSLLNDLGLSPGELEKLNITKRRSASRPLQEFYTAETVALVRQLYDRDFETFGYAREL